MRYIKAGLCAVLLFCLCAVSVRAQTVDEMYREQLTASGADELLDRLPSETRELLDRLGITTLDTTADDADTATWLRELLALIKRTFSAPLAACGTVLGVLLLYAWMQGMRHTLRTDEVGDVFGTVCALVACGTVLLPLSELMAVPLSLTATLI